MLEGGSVRMVAVGIAFDHPYNIYIDRSLNQADDRSHRSASAPQAYCLVLWYFHHYLDNASEKGHDEKDDRQEDVAAKEAWGCFKDASLEKGAQMPSYFSFIVLAGATMAILCLVFTLPLCLIIRSNSTATP